MRHTPHMDRASPASSFQGWFGISPSQARLLVLLLRAEGRVVPPAELSQAAGVTRHAVRTHLSQLREAMDPEALDCERGHGYRLSQIGLDECRQALAAMAAEMRMGQA